MGVGVLGSHFPDYPGSKHSSSLYLPFPFFTYKSEQLEVDGSEVVGRVFAGDNWEINMNFAGSIPTRSENNARAGMDDLGWIGEAGPSLDFILLENDSHELTLRIPVRAAIAARGFDFSYLGLRFDPQVRNRMTLGDKLEWDTTIAATFSERRYHQFMYGVEFVDATTNRPEYQAQGGYSGLRVSTGLSMQLNDKWWIGGFVRYQALHGVVFEQSPLFERRNGVSVGLAVARILFEQ
nr:MipA/OmpV family protein [Aliidiomarina indica]